MMMLVPDDPARKRKTLERYRLRRHTGRKPSAPRGESDYIHLLDGVHHLLKAPLIVVWDRLSTFISKTMKTLLADRDWLTVVLLPGYAPELKPVGGLWARIKRSLANLAPRTLNELETLLRRRLKALYTGTPFSAGSSPGPVPLSIDRTDPKTPKSVTCFLTNATN